MSKPKCERWAWLFQASDHEYEYLWQTEKRKAFGREYDHRFTEYRRCIHCGRCEYWQSPDWWRLLNSGATHIVVDGLANQAKAKSPA